MYLRLRRAAALAASVATVAAMPAAAEAANLTVYGGAKPDGTQVPAGPWTGVNSGATAGGAFGVSMPGFVAPGWSQTASLAAPSGLAFSSVNAVRSLSAPVSFNTAQPRITTTWENRGWWGGGYGGDSGSGAINVTNPSSLSINVSCSYAAYADPNNCSGGGFWTASRMEYVLRDDVVPDGSLANGGGDLVGTAWQTGATGQLTVTASDAGSGVYRAFVNIGGTKRYASVDPSNTACQEAVTGGSAYDFSARASTLVPCRTASDDYEVVFNLAQLGDGTHTNVSVGVEDAAGNEAVVATNRTLRINAPSGALADPGTTGPGGCTIGDAGECTITNTVAPALTGVERQGGTLSTTDGTWVAAPGATYSYAWERCPAAGPLSSCTPIGGETAATYTLKAADVGQRVRSKVTATVGADSTSAFSATSAVIAAGPVNQSPPTLSGTAQEDLTLSATQGTWTGAAGATFTYAWLRCPETGTLNDCTAIAGASASTYTLKAADVGNRVRAVATANLGGALGTGTSSPSGVVAAKPSGGSGGTGGGGGGGGGAATDPKKDDPKEETPKPPANDPSPAGGQQNQPTPPRQVSVPNGDHASRDAKVAVRFVANGAAQLRSKFARSNAIEGTLKTIKRVPITNATVTILAHDSVPGAKDRKLGQVKTDERGRYLFMVKPGPSRTITVSYTAYSDDPEVADTASVRTMVKAGAKLVAGPKRLRVGKTLTLKGKLRNVRQAGVELQVQALDGKTWRTFDTTTTKKGGKFAYKYRFGKAAVGRKFYFRVVIKSPVYPFTPGASNHAKVKVTR